MKNGEPVEALNFSHERNETETTGITAIRPLFSSRDARCDFLLLRRQLESNVVGV